ncbi:hypothetical protein IW492_12045 [Enterococcus sp. BWB1-3]|uniref:hypothetical protein n=1 Tax=Enterococcus sp. BWB1-3 TaxID=2787713 RepID=UPI0019211E3E|nr:hypothetical protein [Enterococcus sp. BWB1-3]MBL1229965.1 hypothetical protein [Enterococcus sp. BWB1-3]
MITSAYPNKVKVMGLDGDIFDGLWKQFNQYPHYIYIENQITYLNDQSRLKELEKYYERLVASPNTVLFWS